MPGASEREDVFSQEDMNVCTSESAVFNEETGTGELLFVGLIIGA